MLLRAAVRGGNELVLGPHPRLPAGLSGTAYVFGLHSDGICAARTPLHVRRHGKPTWSCLESRAWMELCCSSAADVDSPLWDSGALSGQIYGLDSARWPLGRSPVLAPLVSV